MPRDIFGIPNLTLGILFDRIPAAVADAMAAPLARFLVGDLEELGLRKLPYGPLRQIRELGRIPLLDIGTVGLIRQGRIRVRPGVERFTETGVRFVDGREDPYDAVVLATGFHPGVDRFLADDAVALEPGGRPPGSGTAIAPGLYACGFDVSPTGMLREISIEAYAIAERIAAGA